MFSLRIRTLFLLTMTILPMAYGDPATVFDVPRLDGIEIDGLADEWGEGGFHVAVISGADGSFLPVSDFDAQLWLAWDEMGLLVRVEISDDVFHRSPDDDKVFEGDSVELFLVPEPGGSEVMHVSIVPGDTAGAASVVQVAGKGAADAASALTDGGYIVEARLPWAQVELAPDNGDEIGFQLYANDRDPDGSRAQALWYPEAKTQTYPERSQRIRLARRASDPVLVHARAGYTDQGETRVTVVAAAGLEGRGTTAGFGAQEGAGVLAAKDGRAVAELALPMPAWGDAGGQVIDIAVEEGLSAQAELPSGDAWRARLLMGLAVGPQRYVFTGGAFPKIGFAQPLLAERLLGEYTIHTRYYDHEYEEVDAPAAPGRYGAVIEIQSAHLRPIKRYRTLFRAPDILREEAWWAYAPELEAAFPDGKSGDALERYLAYRGTSLMRATPEGAAVAAGIFEGLPASAWLDTAHDPWAVDRQWWVGLKRILYWPDHAIDVDFVTPRSNLEAAAPVIRAGSETDAGMQPGTADAIRAVLEEWAADTDEAFAVAVARKGVLFFHEAYGMRYNKPMTVDTPSWMASISKFISGTLMMMLVDQKLVDLDAPVADYLPALRYIDVETPLTVRDLYNHTNGLQLNYQFPGFYPDHWGDDLHDLDEVIAGYYPWLEVGTRLGYNGVGYALGGKIIELVTEEALPTFFYNHLLGPLEMDHTSIIDGSARGMSTPGDMVRFGQMLLNRGAYGHYRFFSEESYEKMMPKPVRDYRDIEGNPKWGIGAVYTPEPGLSPKTFAHGAASAATLRIDPENELVIVMTRNAAGANFGKYHPRFIAAIAKGLPGAG